MDQRVPDRMGLIERILDFMGVKPVRRVLVDSDVIEEALEIARRSHPHEFVALLEGKQEEDVLHITGLIFLPSRTSDEGAVMDVLMLPPFTGTVGSVHSHPGPSNLPSGADMQFFSKNGLFHMIIAYPYSMETIAAYTRQGVPLEFEIV
ncbi:Mov34/MPN/PAD-1 family protein [Methanothermobacter sp. K4]|uniref:Mov34/MPN/PAD-1 family protein n=1 Tax=Methanothermobacter sp. K4 TaxID=2913262 RepID=UPI001EDA8897|nr:Mov34/MPN/PAD-1 family protein [Methanothermobacter sp. K4]MCG2828357.1 Mov34/MPN/PAD-1 family protein [Methanothermobacter sp. K4]